MLNGIEYEEAENVLEEMKGERESLTADLENTRVLGCMKELTASRRTCNFVARL